MELDLTLLLERAFKGDNEARNELFEIMYFELKQLARRQMERESSDHTLQPTALVHEVWIKLCKSGSISKLKDRQHFLSVAAIAMRQILVDSARAKKRIRRGGNAAKLELREDDKIYESDDELIALDEALDELAVEEPRIAELVNLRFFGGLTNAEASKHLGVSESTADRLWAFGKTWLRSKMSA